MPVVYSYGHRHHHSGRYGGTRSSPLMNPYNDLLNNPVGRYNIVPYGNTHAVILTGDSVFREKGYNLFVSFGGQSNRNSRTDTPLPPIHTTERANTVWFCMPFGRIQMALRLYLYAQLVRDNTREVYDNEGDFVEVVCDNEAQLWEEAEQLAIEFMVKHMPVDYSVIPTHNTSSLVTEYAMGHGRRTGDSSD